MATEIIDDEKLSKSEIYRKRKEDKLIKKADLLTKILNTNAADVGTTSYTSPAFIWGTMPHSEPLDKNGKPISEFKRKSHHDSGDFTITLQAVDEIGIPWGIYPRLILAWFGEQIVKTGNKEIVLSDGGMEGFMADVGVDTSSWGRTGNCKRFDAQLARLLTCRLTCVGFRPGKKHEAQHMGYFKQFSIADEADLWWTAEAKQARKKNPPNPNQLSFPSRIVLTDQFMNLILSAPVPLDSRVLRFLGPSPLAFDVYAWLTYSVYALKEDSPLITWKRLSEQFGAGYKRLRAFKGKFLKQLD